MNSTILTVLALSAGIAVLAGSPAPEGAQTPWSLSGVRHLSGLPGFRQRVAGTLRVGRSGVTFESEGAVFSTESERILKVSVGDERFLKGGVAGRIARVDIPVAGGIGMALGGVSQAFAGIPFAFGFAASLATQSREDIVTVEFLDPRDGYHGAVFTMPRHAADALLERAAGAAALPQTASCASTSSNSLSLLPIAGDDVPAEYRVLLYERLFQRMSAMERPVYRFGNPDCVGWKVKLTIEGFRKGDAVKRGMAGPVGFFLATTSLTYRLSVLDNRGVSVLDDEGKAAIRGGRESLDLGEAVARQVSRKIGRLPANPTPIMP
jgi:hypothetical protein